MNEEQANTMINLLVEISDKLTKLSDKVFQDKGYNSVNDLLNAVISELNNIKLKIKSYFLFELHYLCNEL